MIKIRRVSRLLGMSTLAILWTAIAVAEQPSVAKPLLTKRVDPQEFGVQDDTITVISATSFVMQGDFHYDTTGSLGRAMARNSDLHSYATLDLPAGAVVDFIGLNSETDTDAILGVALWQRFQDGTKSMLAGFSAPAHTWATDLAGPLGVQVASHLNNVLILDVENAPSPNDEFFAWVEVWWHRTVSPAPVSPTFNDVPPSDPAFQYVEALAASGITGGCGGGNYCPNSPVTRRQMAVFLTSASAARGP